MRYLRKKLYVARDLLGKKLDRLEPYERAFFDGFRFLDEALSSIRSARRLLRRLPHADGVPRVYALAELLVKSTGGVLTEENVRTAVSDYTAVVPLGYEELCALSAAFDIALCEYAALYADKIVRCARALAQGAKDAEAGIKQYARLQSDDAYAEGYARAAMSREPNVPLGDIPMIESLRTRRECFAKCAAVLGSRIGAVFESLRTRREILSDTMLLSLSPVAAVLESGDETFSLLDAETKHMYLREIARRARRRKRSETAIAKEILYIAARKSQDISFALLPQKHGKRGQCVYIAVHSAIVAASVILFAFLPLRLAVLFAVLGVPIFYFVVDETIQYICRRVFRAVPLPAYDAKAPAVADSRTVILVPALAATEADIDEAFRHMGTLCAANPSPIFSYCLLLDYPRAQTVRQAEDDARDARIRKAFAAAALPRMSVLVRTRKPIAGDGRYQGYEKKRGAILDFNKFLRTGEGDFSLRLGEELRDAKYVVTLDSDTLCADCLSLVRAKAHPYAANVAVLSLSCKPTRTDTPYARLFAGETGPGRYRLSGGLFDDMFGAGNYTGKGIYDVRAFAALEDFFPDNRILSHDFIEGAVAGCRECGIPAAEEFPQTFLSDLTRSLRWLRGDWQLLPYLRRRVRNRYGAVVDNPVSPIAAHSVLRNCMRSLVPAAQLLIFLLSLYTNGGWIPILLAVSPQLWTTISALPALVRDPRVFFAAVARSFMTLVWVPTTAIYTATNIFITLCRLASGKRLLEWNVSAHASDDISYLPNLVFGAIVAISAYVLDRNPLYIVAAIMAVTAPLWAEALSREKERRAPSAALCAALLDTAAKTFAYFRAQTAYELPCDCYQQDNDKGWCARTSPTNIGMAMAAYVAAYTVGLTDKATMLAYIERTVSAVESCEKYAGNLYNWYDCHTRAVLPPRFVSAVDSGNFLASLLLVAAYTEGALRRRIDALIRDTDLSALYDEKRGLLCIGYDEENKTLTRNHYDLFGSESALSYLVGAGCGKLPAKSFARLDRRAVRYGRIVTAYSWTGGAFEYLMTRLFLRPPHRTMAESVFVGAALAQVKYARKRKKKVFGVSECRYAAYDDGGGNLYRAFGVPHIAYACVPAEAPFAPYAAHLCLPYVSEKIFLRAMHAYGEAGAAGEYGYTESLDGRVPIRSYMTHHQGMTMMAIANALTDDGLTRRICDLSPARVATLLLGEPPVRRAKAKKLYPISPPSERSDEGIYLSRSGALSVTASSRTVRARYRGEDLCDGMQVRVDGGEPFDAMLGEFSAYENAVWRRKSDGLTTDVSLVTMSSPTGVALQVRVRNVAKEARRVRVQVYAEPILDRIESYEAHPAYARMFVEVGKTAQCIWARRREKQTILALCMTRQAKFTGDKCVYYGRGRGSEGGQNGNPCLCAETSLRLEVGEEQTFTASFVVSDSLDTLEHAVSLAAAPECLARQIGGAAPSVSPYIRRVARALTEGGYDAMSLASLGADKPAVPYAVPVSDPIRLVRDLEGFRYLYEQGFAFHLVLCVRATVGISAAKFDTEAMVEHTGIRRVSVGEVSVRECEVEQYKELFLRGKRTLPEEISCAAKQLCRPPSGEASGKPWTTPCIAQPLGIGGFTDDNAYALDLTNVDTPAPWSNILADGVCGMLATESGGGYTFGENSRQHKWTAWSNDPVCDPPSEFVALRCGDAVWSVSKRPLRRARATYHVVHARGYTTYECEYGGIAARQTVFVSRTTHTKWTEVELYNGTASSQDVDVTFAIRPVLGDFIRYTLPSLSWQSVEGGMRLTCGQSGVTVYVCGEGELFARGARVEEERLYLYEKWDKAFPFYALTTRRRIEAGETVKVRFSLSADPPPREEDTELARRRAVLFYDGLCRVTFDGAYGYLSAWLPYQVYNARFVGRTGYYQAGGAYGFRDQLQDCLALLYCDPAAVREHLLRCAAHQFEHGDVQHWWHPPAVGVRTRICDDKLWLPYVACAYIAQTGDAAVLDERAPYLCDVSLPEGAASVYASAPSSACFGTLYEHCVRAVRASFDFGADGLVRIRGGDWNDGFDGLGILGKGTSVWASMFLYAVVEKFMPYLRDPSERKTWRNVSDALYAAVERAYEVDRFTRAVRDDGHVLGSARSSLCRIDLLTQSWSVLARIGDAQMRRQSLQTAYELLYDPQHRLLRLLDPPFESPEGVGYIGKYPPYVRENGGQYTQAAIWYVCALFAAGETERANALLQGLSPSERADTPQKAADYCVEPFVMPADVYGGAAAGKGGWTWYTGSAAWMYVCLVEYYAGISVRGDVVTFDPKLPPDTPELHVTFAHGDKKILVTIRNGARGAWHVRIGDVTFHTNALRLGPALVGKRITVFRGE